MIAVAPSNCIMRARDCGVRIALTITCATVSTVSAFAQSDTRVRAARMLARGDVAPHALVRTYSDDRAGSVADASIPSNVHAPEMYRSSLLAMLRVSPTLRRQFQRVADAAHVTVSLRPMPPGPADSPRARTVVTRPAGGEWIAAVEIKPTGSLPELLAHEFEHIVEQLDGIDLETLASQANSGVTRCADGSFETTRAVRVGEMVAREVRDGR